MDKDDKTILALLQNDMSYMKDKIDSIDTKVSNHYVTKEEFQPIKMVVYGLVGLILVAVVGALIALVVNSGAK